MEAAGADLLVAMGNRELAAVSPITLSPRWRTPASSQYGSDLALEEGTVYLLDHDRAGLQAFDAASGAKVGQFSFGFSGGMTIVRPPGEPVRIVATAYDHAVWGVNHDAVTSTPGSPRILVEGEVNAPPGTTGLTVRVGEETLPLGPDGRFRCDVTPRGVVRVEVASVGSCRPADPHVSGPCVASGPLFIVPDGRKGPYRARLDVASRPLD